MADSGVELAIAQVVEEVQEEAEALGGAEAPKDDESPAMADGTVTAAGDHKRKLDDLEPREGDEEAPLKKQEVSADALALAADEPGSGDGEVAAAGGFVDRSGNCSLALSAFCFDLFVVGVSFFSLFGILYCLLFLLILRRIRCGTAYCYFGR